MRFLRQSLIGVFLASLTLALLLFAGQIVMSAIQERMSNEKESPPARERIFAVDVIEARLETVTPVLVAFGQVQSRRTLEIRAAMGGRVIELSEHFEEGGTVRQGDILVRVDPANAQAQLDRAQSDLLDALAEERDAKRGLILARDDLDAAEEQSELRGRAFQRQKDLQDRGVGTTATVETAELAAAAARQSVLSRRQAVAQAEARIDQAATRLSRARIALESAKRDLAESTVTARFDGTLSDVTLVEGRLVSANEKLAELVDPNALEVAFRVSTAQYSRLLDGNGKLLNTRVRATLDVTGADLIATGVISRDSAAAGEGQSGRLIFARLDDSPGFKPGDFVTVSVEEPPLEKVARLPSSALDAANRVLALGDDDRLEEIEVQILRRQGDDVLVTAPGLEGREIVVARTPLLGPGIRVRRLRENAAAEPEQAMLELSDERRARLVASVEANKQMPDAVKARVLAQLAESQVPVRLVERIESRSGG